MRFYTYFTYLNNICSIRCWHKIEWKPVLFGEIKTFLCYIVVNFDQNEAVKENSLSVLDV